MSKRAKLKTALNKQYQKGWADGTQNITGILMQTRKDHKRQVSSLIQSHKKELQIMEREHNLKLNRLNRKIDKVDMLISEWDSKVKEIREMSARTHEIFAKVDQTHYQNRKQFEIIRDEKKSQENIDRDLKDALKRTTLSRITRIK